MSRSGLLADISVAAILLALSFSLQILRLHGRLENQWDREARALARPIETFAQRAHAQKDDLALQDAVQALAKTPGVSFAAVLDPAGRPLADSRLGEKTGRWPAGAAVFHRPLRSASESWGDLVFSWSRRPLRQIWAGQALGTLAAALCLWGLSALRSWFFYKKQLAQKRELSLKEALIAEQRLAFDQAEQRHQGNEEALVAILRGALSMLPRPCVILDSRQKVIVAQGLTGCPSGSSWSEIPALQDQGPLLEESIRRLDDTVSFPGADAAQMRARSHARLNGDLAGTFIWIER